MIIYLQDRRLQAAGLLSKLQHFIGGFPLLFIGLKHLSSGSPEWVLAIVEVAIGGVVVATFVREVRQTLKSKAHDHSSAWHAAVGWFDLAAGGLLIFEAFHQPHVKPGYMRPQFLSGVITIGIGLFHGRLQAFQRRRRYLKFEADRVEGRLGPFRRFSFATDELKSVEISAETVVFQPDVGEQKMIRLGRYSNRDEIWEAIANHARAAGLLAGGERHFTRGQSAEPDNQPNSA